MPKLCGAGCQPFPTCGGLAIHLPLVPGAPPASIAVRLRLAAMWGAVENPSKVGRTIFSSSAGVFVAPAILSPVLCPELPVKPRGARVFIAFGGPEGHDDRLATCADCESACRWRAETLPEAPRHSAGRIFIGLAEQVCEKYGLIQAVFLSAVLSPVRAFQRAVR